MGLYTRPELHEKRSNESETFKLINEIRRVTVGCFGEAAALDPATTEGFATTPVCHGIPVGVPDPVQQDRVPWVVDDVDLRVYFYVLGGWHYVALT